MQGVTDPLVQKYANKPKISSLGDKASMIFSLLGVSDEHDENLRIFDENLESNLILIHYFILHPDLYHIRGIIIDLGEEKIVAGTFPYTEEFPPSDEKAKNIEVDKDTYVTTAYEGTILRMFRAPATGNWFLATHKKIDGRRSRWAGLTFGETWQSIWGDFKYDDYLKHNLCYSFLLSDPSNRLVCDIPELKLYHVGTFVENSIRRVSQEDWKILHPDVELSLPIPDIKTNEDLLEKACDLNWRFCTGLLVNSPSGIFKLIPDNYLEMRELRGGEPNIRMRYLHLLTTKEADKLRELLPEKVTYFDEIDDQLKQIPYQLADIYEARYVQKQYMRLPREQFYVLENVHKGDNSVDIITRIKEVMSVSNPRQLNALIKYFILSQ